MLVVTLSDFLSTPQIGATHSNPLSYKILKGTAMGAELLVFVLCGFGVGWGVWILFSHDDPLGFFG